MADNDELWGTWKEFDKNIIDKRIAKEEDGF